MSSFSSSLSSSISKTPIMKVLQSLNSFEGIFIKGAREHNLKNIDVKIPRNKITVITGLSGSGKSSLAFDVLYYEGHRHYMESLSSSSSFSSSHFIETFKKPDVDFIFGLSPTLAIDQKNSRAHPRSTVGTVTEIYDFMRLLFSHKGVPQCPEHKVEMKKQSIEQMVKNIMSWPKKTPFLLFAPMVQGKKGEFSSEIASWIRKGFLRGRVDGEWIELEKAVLERHKKHNIDLLLDELVVKENFTERLKKSLSLGLELTKGMVGLEIKGKKPLFYSLQAACPICHMSLPQMDLSFFSFNNPKGACSLCKGLGFFNSSHSEDSLFDPSEEEGKEEGMDLPSTCPECHGSRLKKEVLSVYFEGKNIAELSRLSLSSLRSFLGACPKEEVSKPILSQILHRLNYLIKVGVPYLSVDRSVRTLSGGEMQRVRMATQVGSALKGVTYVLDEPSVGLHPKDHYQLIQVLKDIKKKGNTVCVVEHDKESILSADHIIDLGPGAGVKGGDIVAEGSLKKILQNEKSLTGQYLSKKKVIPLSEKRRPKSEKKILLAGAKGNNLKDLNVEFPLGLLCGITGVSGSGKSSLILDTLYRILASRFYSSSLSSLPYKNLSGTEWIQNVVQINQKPIGRSPRSTPSTYTGLFSFIRDLYAKLPEAQIRGFGNPKYFSFNAKGGGRCDVCNGQGFTRVQMNFLQDVFVTCEVCQGLRFSPDVLSVQYKNKSISDVLNMTVSEALDFFKYHRHIHRKLNTLMKVNLDYLSLGQSSTTLSGGEAQRVKLSRELSKKKRGKTLYILDEPTTGLHFEDIKKLLDLLNELVDLGNTVMVIEHNLDVIKSCDHLIDLGPAGGEEGGEIVAEGTPEEVASHPISETGRFLKKEL